MTNRAQRVARTPVALEWDAHLSIPDRAVPKWALRIKRSLWLCLPISLRLLVAYLRTLPQHIREERKIYWDTSDGSPLVPPGLAKELASFHGIRTYRHAYIEDMTRLREQYPFLTAFELLIAQRAWNDGTQCIQNNVCTVSGQTSSDSSNSMLSTSQMSAGQP